MKILLGLGNPGELYQKSRHNVGFMFLDFIAATDSDKWIFNKKFNALILEKKDLTLIKPMTFMNESGLTIRSFLSYYQLLPKKLGLLLSKNTDFSSFLTVIHDDLDIDFSKFKISSNISSAGHNGVQSIINHLKSKNFQRLRFGINNEYKKNIKGENFVLQPFSREELKKLNNIFLEARNKLL